MKFKNPTLTIIVGLRHRVTAVSSGIPLSEKARKTRARSPRQPYLPGVAQPGAQTPPLLDLRVTFDQVRGFAEFVWSEPSSKRTVAAGRVRCTGPDQLTLEIEKEGQREPAISTHHRNSIRAAMGRWLVAEKAWRTDLHVERSHQAQEVQALFVPRSRQWRMAGPEPPEPD